MVRLHVSMAEVAESWRLHMENLHCDEIHFIIVLDKIHCITFMTCECVTLSDPTTDSVHSKL